jgi:hypothetical protein
VDENDMAALLGYLIAVAVFLGSGYAGLEWLTAPDDPVTHQHPSGKPTSSDAKPNKHAANIAGTKEVTPSVKDKTGPRTASPASADKARREEAKAVETSSEISKMEKQDTVPTGGCMPIGLTANGEMVFPLQCRELIEHQRGPVAVPSMPPLEAAPTPAQNGVQVSAKPERSGGAAAPSTADANDKLEPSKSDVASAEPKHVEEKNLTQPTGDSKGQSESRISPNEKGGNYRAVSAHASNEVSATNTVKPSNAKKPEKRKVGADRHNLVLMRLQTLEFSDGHREQRLLPLRQSLRAALQSDRNNPLGLR